MPTGTVTFLLTDVVESTASWQRHPDDMPRAIRTHEQLIRSVLPDFGGYEFGTAGDSFAVAFSAASDAVGAAVAAQRALAAHEWDRVAIQVRMGLHSGQADERDGRYYGTVVNQAARIEQLAGPGQIVVSAVTQSLARGRVADDVVFEDLGEHKLKSFEGPARLFQIRGEGICADSIPESLRAVDRLPRFPTAFVGRDAELDDLVGLVNPGEVVTVTGLGGLGKTRLAIEAARAATERFSDGVWWVDLTPLSDGTSIAVHAAAALGIAAQANMSSSDSLVDGLRRQQALILFDNCEHVIDEAAALIALVQSGCPEVAVLATSREPLDVAGERNWPLATLPASTDGVALLVARATAHDAGFDASRWPAADLVDLCTRLDGMPLAIEMAAARLRALSPAEVIDRLEDRFRLLRSRDRLVAERHRSLLAALDWSYELLDPDERLLLDRLSTFAGSFDLRSTERVCADERLDEFDILDLLTSLLEKSLISQVDSAGASRYRLLETVRDYCAAHLDDEDRRTLRTSLVEHAIGIIEENDPKWLGEDRADFDDAFVTYAEEWDNFREAIRWAVEAGDGESCDKILRALWVFAFETFRTEIGDWARSTFAIDPPPLAAVGLANVLSNDRERSIERLLDRLALVDESTPNYSACLCYGVLHGMHLAQAGPEALRFAERSWFHAPAMSTSREASHRANLASLLVDTDPALAAEHAEFALDYVATSGNPWRSACVPPLAIYEAKRGRSEVGHRLCEDAIAISTDGRLIWSLTSALACRARISLRYRVGDPRSDLREAITVGRETRAWYAVWLAMSESVVWLAAHCPRDVAATVAGYLSHRKIWFRPLPDDARPASADLPGQAQIPGAGMRRDELIDFVIGQLDA